MTRRHCVRVIAFASLGLVTLVSAVRTSLKAQPPSVVATELIEGAFGGGGGQRPEVAPPPIYLPSPAMTLAEARTRLKLHDKVPMNFPNDTTLQEVLDYIRKATIDQSDFPDGVCIYADPRGLQDADKTLSSTVVINLKNLPLETTLELLLKQLDLTYWINKDGLIIITSVDESHLTPATMSGQIMKTLSALRAEIHSLRAELRNSIQAGGDRTFPHPPLPATSGSPNAGLGGFR